MKLTASGPPLSSSTMGSSPGVKGGLSDPSLDVSSPLRALDVSAPHRGALDDQKVKKSPNSSIQIPPPRVAWQPALVLAVLPPIAPRAREQVNPQDGQSGSPTHKQVMHVSVSHRSTSHVTTAYILCQRLSTPF